MLKLTRNWLLLQVLAAFCCSAGIAGAAETVQEWELVIPTGVIEQAHIEPAKRISDLAGKTVVLRWNGKNNGDLLLDRLAEKLGKDYPTAKVVKSYTADTSLNAITGHINESQRVAKVLKGMSPDIIIAAQAD
jgi:hypothetical protein